MIVLPCVPQSVLDYWWPLSEVDGWEPEHRWAPNAGFYRGVACLCGEIPEAPGARYEWPPR